MSSLRRACGLAGCVSGEVLVDQPGGLRLMGFVEVGDVVFWADGERDRVRAVLAHRHGGPIGVLRVAEIGLRRLTAEPPVRILDNSLA